MLQRRQGVAQGAIWGVRENASLDLRTREDRWFGSTRAFSPTDLGQADEMNYPPEWSRALSSPALLPEEISDRKGHILLPAEPSVSRRVTTSHGYH